MDQINIQGLGSVPFCAVEFFTFFSRFEFALLAGGYVGGVINEHAWADWDRFGHELHKSFLVNVTNDAEVAVLFAEPPRKLVRTNFHACKFVDNAAPKDAVSFLLLVRTIRNNLFHGSKVFFGERDRELVTAGIRALRLALDAAALTPATNRVSSAWGYAELGSS